MKETKVRWLIYQTKGDLNELARMYVRVLERVEEISEALKKRGAEGDVERANAMLCYANGYKDGEEIKIEKGVYERAFRECYPQMSEIERKRVISTYKVFHWINADAKRGVAKKEAYDGGYYICYRRDMVDALRGYVRVQEARRGRNEA